jgi:hypothetical protein
LEFHSGREADHSPSSSAEVKEWVELYLHSPIRLHGVVFRGSTGFNSSYRYGQTFLPCRSAETSGIPVTALLLHYVRPEFLLCLHVDKQAEVLAIKYEVVPVLN